MEGGDCGVVWECGVTFFIYLFEVFDEMLGVVGGGGGIFEYAKSVVRINIVVFTAACRRTANTFAINAGAFSDILLCLIF
jgi:hypothetical protein